MKILDIAIQAEGGVTKLANAIGEKPNAVSNWRKRGVPKAWGIVLATKYKKQLKAAEVLA